jgi:hypothetical protein
MPFCDFRRPVDFVCPCGHWRGEPAGSKTHQWTSRSQCERNKTPGAAGASRRMAYTLTWRRSGCATPFAFGLDRVRPLALSGRQSAAWTSLVDLWPRSETTGVSLGELEPEALLQINYRVYRKRRLRFGRVSV